jgi:glycosyltransferase involved in cell wall biosynthesis
LIENDPGPLEHAPLGLRRRIRRFFCRCPDLILTNNAAGTRYLTDKLSVPADKIVTAVYQTSAIPHHPEHPPEMAGKPDRAKIRFLFVGQLIERKGVDRLLKAVALLDTNLRQRCHVTIIGDGDARESLHELMHALGIAEQVTMLGHVPYAELPAHYAGADVFVLPTLFDYRACVSFEALSQGLALLMSNRNGAVAEVVDEGENGFSFDPDNVPELAERLAWFIADPRHLARFRRRSLQLAVNFTVENAIDNLAQACQRCLDGRQQQAGPI